RGHAYQTHAITGAHSYLLRRVGVFDVGTLAHGEGDGGNHTYQQNQRANFHRKNVVRIHGDPDSLGVVVVVGHDSSGTCAEPGFTQHERHFQHHDQTNGQTQRQISLETRTQLLHADIEHHHDEQEQHHDGAYVNNDQQQSQKL